MPTASSLRVLVVDDQRAMRALVMSSLRTFGCVDMIECADGNEALRVLSVRKVHLVISDLNMPGLDGLGLLREIRSQDAIASLPVIMLTSRGEIEFVRQAVKLGVNNYLMKPFTVGGLKRKIEAVFGSLT